MLRIATVEELEDGLWLGARLTDRLGDGLAAAPGTTEGKGVGAMVAELAQPAATAAMAVMASANQRRSLVIAKG